MDEVRNSLGARLRRYYTAGFPERRAFARGPRGLVAYALAIFREKPLGLQRFYRLQPLLALVTGVVGIALMRAGYSYARVACALLFVGLGYVVWRLLTSRARTSTWARIGDYAVQMIFANILLFVTPFYVESSVLPSRHALFLCALAALTLTACIDRLYERFVLVHPFMLTLYSGAVAFCALNFMLPVLLGLRNNVSVPIAYGVAFVLVLGLAGRRGRLPWRGWLKAALLLAVLGGTVFLGRSLLPPAPLRLMGATPCLGIVKREPLAPFDTLSVGSAKTVSMHSAVFAPLGLSEPLWHVWYYEGREVARLSAGALVGGRREGYRNWTRRTLREGEGHYEVQVWTEGGQLLGVGAFDVVP